MKPRTERSIGWKLYYHSEAERKLFRRLKREVNVPQATAEQRIQFAINAIRKHGFIDPPALACVVEVNAKTSLPAPLRQYICKVLRGEVRRPRGRRLSVSSSIDHEIDEIRAALIYPKLVVALGQEKYRSPGLQKPVRQRALEMIRENLGRFGGLSPNTIAKIISNRRGRLRYSK